MEGINYVNCCAEFGKLLEELPNDQNANPGYRHIRITASLGGLTYCKRVRFCPGCGTEFKIEGAPGSAKRFELVEQKKFDEYPGDGLRVVFLDGNEAKERERRTIARSGGGLETGILYDLGLQELRAGDVVQLQGRLYSRVVTERKRM